MTALMLAVALASATLLFYSSESSAAVTAEHRKQVDEVRKEVGKVKALIGKKDFDDAAKILDEAEQKLKQVAKDAGIEESDKLVAALLKQVEQQRAALAKKRGGGAAGGGGAFERDVAPILAARCLTCHGSDNPRANLRIDTFAGIIKGGDSGPIVVPDNPAESLLIQRISASGSERMPKRGNPLSADEIGKITAWIADGAKFTGNNLTPLGDLKAAEPARRDTSPLQINKPTGNETVSFKDDIAPFMVNLCVGCHSGDGRGLREGGLSLESFERLMKGGKSGRVVLPGNTKDSRLWHLVGEQEPIKMPPGQALITKTNHRNLRTWIEEGAKFDGSDPKAPLRSLILTDAQKRAKELSTLSPEDFARRRKERAAELWRKAFPNDPSAEHESAAFLVIGNVPEPRLKQVADWAQEDAERLQKMFKIKEGLIWRGKLIVFVFKDGFSYGEFTQTNEGVQVPAETKGHSRVTAGEDEAYVCLQDIGDSASDDSPGVRAQLMALLAEALLQRSANRVPDWAARGTGLALAVKNDSKNPYFRALNAGAHEALRSIGKPEEIFANGTFPPGDLAPVSYTLVSHMLKLRGEPQFVQFLDQLRHGKDVNQALQAVYSVDTTALAQSYRIYVDNLPGARVGSKKAKK
jgi:cytochrome c553